MTIFDIFRDRDVNYVYSNRSESGGYIMLRFPRWDLKGTVLFELYDHNWKLTGDMLGFLEDVKRASGPNNVIVQVRDYERVYRIHRGGMEYDKKTPFGRKEIATNRIQFRLPTANWIATAKDANVAGVRHGR